MNPFDFESALNQRVRTMQIIVGALIGGVLTFSAIAYFVRSTGNVRGAGTGGMLGYVALAFAGSIGAAYAVVPRSMVRNLRRQMAKRQASGDPAARDAEAELLELCNVYLTQLIVGAALLEGLAFFCNIVFLVEGNWIGLGAAICLAAALVMKLPTATHLSAWLARQQDLIEYERSLV